MNFETCPLLEELHWLSHRFFDYRHPSARENKVGMHAFSQEYPSVLFLPQTHSDHVITANEPFPDGGADASVTWEDDLGLAIKTADCCPILLACTQSKLIAAVHAGWRGALNQITAKTVAEMDRRGANPKHIVAAIGPHLQEKSFFVQEDVHGKFALLHPEALVHFIPHDAMHWRLDIGAIIRQQLNTAGVTAVWESPTDTLTSPHFASYRRRGTDPECEKTRNVSIIMKINP